MEVVVSLLAGGRTETARVVDDTPETARIVDGREPVQALIGYAPNLGTAATAILALADGRLDDRLPGTPTARRLSGAIAGASLPLTREALFLRLAGGIDSSSPLSRTSANEENAPFAASLDRLKTADGWRGGADVAAALTRRAKIVGRAGGDDLPFETAVDRLCAALPSASARIGYLLDLATTTLGKSRVSAIVERVGSALSHVSTVADAVPPGTPPEKARRVLELRLRKSELPRAALETLTRRLAGLPDDSEVVTLVRTRGAGMILHVGDRPFDIPRDGSEFVLGREHACHARIEEPSVSRRHASIVFQDGIYRLTDTGRNGTTVILADGRAVYLASGETCDLTDASGEIRVTPGEDGPPRVRVTWRLTNG